MNYRQPELRNKLAAEYVLGTLQGGARRRFESLLRDDMDLRVLVETWTERLIPVGISTEEPAPSTRVWFEIDQRLGQSASTGAEEPSRLRWWQSLRPGGWAGALTGAAGGLALGVAAMVLIAPGFRVDDVTLRSGKGSDVLQPRVVTDGQLPDSYIVVLTGRAGAPALLAASLRTGTILRVKVLEGFTIGADELPVLWALSDSGPPRPLGTLPTEGATDLDLPLVSEQALARVGELAVSIESRAARPFSAPQGAYLLRGPLIKSW